MWNTKKKSRWGKKTGKTRETRETREEREEREAAEAAERQAEDDFMNDNDGFVTQRQQPIYRPPLASPRRRQSPQRSTHRVPTGKQTGWTKKTPKTARATGLVQPTASLRHPPTRRTSPSRGTRDDSGSGSETETPPSPDLLAVPQHRRPKHQHRAPASRADSGSDTEAETPPSPDLLAAVAVPWRRRRPKHQHRAPASRADSGSDTEAEAEGETPLSPDLLASALPPKQSTSRRDHRRIQSRDMGSESETEADLDTDEEAEFLTRSRLPATSATTPVRDSARDVRTQLQSSFTYDELPWKDATGHAQCGAHLARLLKQVVTPANVAQCVTKKYDGHWALVADDAHLFLTEMCHRRGFHSVPKTGARRPDIDVGALYYRVFDVVSTAAIRRLDYPARLDVARNYLARRGHTLVIREQYARPRAGNAAHARHDWATNLTVRDVRVVDTAADVHLDTPDPATLPSTLCATIQHWARQEDGPHSEGGEGAVLSSAGAFDGTYRRYKLKPVSDAEIVVDKVNHRGKHSREKITSLEGYDARHTERVTVTGTIPDDIRVGDLVTYKKYFAASARNKGIFLRLRTDDLAAAVATPAQATPAQATKTLAEATKVAARTTKKTTKATPATKTAKAKAAAGKTAKATKTKAQATANKTAKTPPNPHAERNIPLLAKYFNCLHEKQTLGTVTTDVDACMRRQLRTVPAQDFGHTPSTLRYCNDRAYSDDDAAHLARLCTRLRAVGEKRLGDNRKKDVLLAAAAEDAQGAARGAATASACGTHALMLLPPNDPVRQHLMAGKDVRVRSSSSSEYHVVHLVVKRVEPRAGAMGESVCYVPALSCNCESFLYGNSGATVELSRNTGEHAPLRLARRDNVGGRPPDWVRTCTHIEFLMDPTRRDAHAARDHDRPPQQRKWYLEGAGETAVAPVPTPTANLRFLCQHNRVRAAEQRPSLLHGGTGDAGGSLAALRASVDAGGAQSQLSAIQRKLHDVAQKGGVGGEATGLALFITSRTNTLAPLNCEHLLAGGTCQVRGSTGHYDVRLVPDSAQIRTPVCTCPSFQKPNHPITRKVHMRGKRDATQLGEQLEQLPFHLRICKHLAMVLTTDDDPGVTRVHDGSGAVSSIQ